MKKIILILLSLSLSLIANIYNLKPLTITNDIHCIIGDFNPPTKENNGFVSNMCYVDIGNSIVVLDAGPTYKFAQEFYQIIKKDYPKKNISHVVLSNFHDDRTQGASFFQEKGAKIVGYKNLNNDIKENKEKFERMKMILSPDVLENTKVILADTLVGNGYKIVGSKKTLEIVKLSAVSEEKSDIAIYSKDDSFFFVGNIVFNGRMLNYTKNSNIDGWIEALENLGKYNAKYILGGHGKEYHKDSYKPSLEYLQILRKDLKKAYDDGVDTLDLEKAVKSDKFHYLNFYKQLNYNNIQNYYYQLEWEK